MSRRSPHGFTLIELMISVAIVGILASVALPSLSTLQFRSKSAERKFMMQSIYRAIDDVWVRDSRFPADSGGGVTTLNLPDQPNASPGTTKRVWRLASSDPTDHWGKLGLTVEGAVYYSYSAVATASGNRRDITIIAYGDLDGDGIQNVWTKQWNFVNGIKQLRAGSTLDCPDCSYATEDNPETF
jgi:prepilin-type N-terminal cleavage/methylation domain-containing protein